jgi:hypothetical protein
VGAAGAGPSCRTRLEHVRPGEAAGGQPPWTCPGGDVFFNMCITWGVVGPLRMFGCLGRYTKINYFLLAGQARQHAGAVRRNGDGAAGVASELPHVGLLFNYVVYRRYKGWWARHNYVLSTGVAYMGIVSYAVLQSGGVNGGHCALARRPTTPGVRAPVCLEHRAVRLCRMTGGIAVSTRVKPSGLEGKAKTTRA